MLGKPSLAQGRQLSPRRVYPSVTENPTGTDSGSYSGGLDRELDGGPPAPSSLPELRRWMATGEGQPTELWAFLPSGRKWVSIGESVRLEEPQHSEAQGKQPPEKVLPSPGC